MTGSDLHEPKGASTASANTVYVSDGAGSGTWKTLPVASIDGTSVKGLNTRYFTVVFKDISTAGSLVVPIVENCVLVSVKGVLNAAISVADCGLTVTKNGGTTLATGTITQSGSAKGTSVTMTASVNTLVSGDYIEIASDGASSTASDMTFLLKFTI